MSRPSVRSLCALVLGLVLASACVSNRSFREGLDDQNVDWTLKRTLLSDTNYDTGDVDITVFEGRLLLTGTVRSTEARADIAAKAANIASVREVINELIIGPRTSIGRGAADALADQQLRAALVADNGVYGTNFQTSISGGVAYIIGVAQGPEELARVIGHAQTISRIESIVSHVLFVGDPRRQN